MMDSEFDSQLRLTAKDEVSPVVDGIGTSIDGLVNKVMGLAAAYGAFSTLKSLVMESVKFAGTLETTGLGIASVVQGLTVYKNSQGEVIQGLEAFNLAQQDSIQIQQQLKMAALQTSATYIDMVEAYQVGIGPMKRAGIQMSDTVEATKRLTQAMGAFGVPMRQLGIEMRQFFEGDFARSRLLQSLNITAAQIKEMTASGKLMDLLRQKTEGIAHAGDLVAATFEGLKSNITDFFQQTLGQAGEGMFKSVKELLKAVQDQFATVQGGAVVFNPETMAALKTFFDGVARVTDKVRAELLPAFADLGKAILSALGSSTTTDAINQLIGWFAKIIEVVAQFISTWGDLLIKFGLFYKLAGALFPIFSSIVMWMANLADLYVAVSAGVQAANLSLVAFNVTLGATVLLLAAVTAGLIYAIKLWGDLRDEEKKAETAQSNSKDAVVAAYKRLADSIDTTTADGFVLSAQIKKLDRDFQSGAITLEEYTKKLREMRLERDRLDAKKPKDDVTRGNQDPQADTEKMKKLIEGNMKLDMQLAALRDTGIKGQLDALNKEAALQKYQYEMMLKEKMSDEERNANVEKAIKQREILELKRQKILRQSADIDAKNEMENRQKARSIDLIGVEGPMKDSLAALYKYQNETDKINEEIRKAHEKGWIEGLKAEKHGLEEGMAAWAEYTGTIALHTKKAAESVEKVMQDAEGSIREAMGDTTWQPITAAMEKVTKQSYDLGEQLKAGFITGEQYAKANNLVWEAFGATVQKVREQVQTFTEKMQSDAQRLQRLMVTAGQGVEAAFATIAASTKNMGQVVFDTIVGISQSIESNFSSGLVAMFKNDADAVKNTFKALADDIQKIFADMVTQLIKKQIVKMVFGVDTDQGQGGDQWGRALGGLFGGGSSGASGAPNDSYRDFTPGGWSPVDQSGTGSQQNASFSGGVGNYASNATKAGVYGGYAAMAYGLGMAIASSTGRNKSALMYGDTNLGMQDYGGNATMTPYVSAAMSALAIGAAAAGIGVVIGAVAAAVILLVGAVASLINGPKEGSFAFGMSGSAGAAAAIDPITREVVGNQGNFVADLARAGGKTGQEAGEMRKAWEKIFKETYGSAGFNVQAGSPEDMQKGVEQLMKQTIPKMAVQAAFGQVGVGMPHGNRDAQGGQAGLDWNMMNPTFMDKEGNWIKQQLYDPNAPIPSMLAGIGFTQNKIKDIATKLAGSGDIEKFKTWLMDLVTLVVGINTTMANMKKSATDIFKELAEDKANGPLEAFKKSAGQIAELAAEVSNYTGDEQVTKAKEVLKLADERYQEELKYLQQISDTITAITTSVTALQERMAHWNETADQTAMRLWGSLMGRETMSNATYANTFNAKNPDFGGGPLTAYSWQNKINAAKTPEEIAKIEQEVEGIIGKLFDYFSGLVVAGKALQQDFKDLGADLRNISATARPNTSGVTGFRAQVDTIFGMVTAAEKKTGAEYLADMAKVRDATKSMYATLLQTLQTIRQNADELHRSIAAQIHDLDYEDMTPQEKAKDLMARMKADQEALKNAKTPEEVKRLTDEIQNLGSTYMQLFGPDDPNRKDAKEWLKSILKLTEDTATAAYGNMEAVTVDAANRLADVMDKAGYDVGAFVWHAEMRMKELGEALTVLRDTANAALTALGNQVTLTNADLIPALAALKTNFTDLADIVGPKGGPGGKMGPDFRDAAEAARDFTAAVNGATRALSGGGD